MIGKKLLVADDSLTIQKVIRLALSNEGYEIQTVSDGNDAVQQIAVFRPDVVLIDVALPNKNAFEVKTTVESSKEIAPVRFIVMSSAYEKVDEQQIESARFDGRLTKPFDPAHLRKVLNEALAISLPDNKATEAAPFADLPPAPPTEIANNELWDQDGDFIMPPPPPAMPPGLSPEFAPPPPLQIEEPLDLPPLPGETGVNLAPPPGPPRPPESDTDIKHLTESTIRMSGLDDFQWNINEPSLKPPSSLTEPGDSTFHLEPAPGMPVFEPAPPSEAPADLRTFDFNEAETISASGVAPSMAAGISRDEIEEMIKKHLQAAIEEALKGFAKETLPNVAEKVIKAEIHRLLSEQSV